MKEQLIKIMTHFTISSTRFADEIGVQRSSVSHILSGRNKPSYDFIIKILEKYPSINSLWLLTGKGTMISGETDAVGTAAEEPVYANRIAESREELIFETRNQDKGTKQTNDDISNQLKEATNVNNLISVILLYTDGTFLHFKKAKDQPQ
jgi:plasmid maintenance system antidote protein VapI